MLQTRHRPSHISPVFLDLVMVGVLDQDLAMEDMAVVQVAVAVAVAEMVGSVEVQVVELACISDLLDPVC